MYLIFIFPFRFCQVISTFVSRLFLRSRCCCYCATRKKNGVGKKSRVHGDDRTNGDRRSTISRASDRSMSTGFCAEALMCCAGEEVTRNSCQEWIRSLPMYMPPSLPSFGSCEWSFLHLWVVTRTREGKGRSSSVNHRFRKRKDKSANEGPSYSPSLLIGSFFTPPSLFVFRLELPSPPLVSGRVFVERGLLLLLLLTAVEVRI